MPWSSVISVRGSVSGDVHKTYCEKCDIVFESREKFERHAEGHSSGVACEECPIDVAIARFVGLLRRAFRGGSE